MFGGSATVLLATEELVTGILNPWQPQHEQIQNGEQFSEVE